MTVFSETLSGEVIAFEEFLPRGVYFGRVLLVVFVKLIDIAYVSIGDVGILVA